LQNPHHGVGIVPDIFREDTAVFQGIGVTDFIDVALMSVLVYLIMIWFKRTRAAFVLTGIIIVAIVYLFAQQFNLYLTASVLQGFFAAILLAFFIIFQEEIRKFFEQIAMWGMLPGSKQKAAMRLPSSDIEVLVKTVVDLAKEKIGAILVVRGKNMIVGHLNEGVSLDGRISEPLIKSIFDPHSAGHDGAVIIEGNRIVQFAAHLPLSKHVEKLDHRGTRHAAALGLSEVTDSLCIVVSEERGTISIARNGEMKAVDGYGELLTIIEQFYGEIHPLKEKGAIRNILRKNLREKLIAVFMAVMLWFVHVYGSEISYKTIEVPMNLVLVPSGLTITDTDPAQVSVTFSGPKRSLYFLHKSDVQLAVNALGLHEGYQTIRIRPSNFEFPKNLALENIDPPRVDVVAEKK
jgi:uncharacterized protein (TIGR00159 family)